MTSAESQIAPGHESDRGAWRHAGTLRQIEIREGFATQMPMGISSTSNKETGAIEAERKQTVALQEQTGGVVLRTLLEGVSARSGLPAGELLVRQIANDSRKVRP